MKPLLVALASLALVVATSAPVHADYVAPHVEHAAYGKLKIVTPLTAGDEKIWTMKLRNAQNAVDAAKAWSGTLDLRIVLWAQGVHILDKPSDENIAKIDALRAAGVRFIVCANTLREQKLDFHALYGVAEADIVPAGFLEVPYLELREGFAVSPAN